MKPISCMSKEILTTKKLQQKLTEPDTPFEYQVIAQKLIIDYSRQFKLSRVFKGPLKSVAETNKLIDQLVAEAEPEDRQEFKCRKGCSFCCHMNVTISKDEADNIGAYCKKNNIPINKKHLKRQLLVNEEELNFSPFSACVFLENNQCKIYEARPYACRNHHVYSEPEKCNIKQYGLARVAWYFNIEIECLIAGAWNHSPIDRMPKLLLPYSK